MSDVEKLSALRVDKRPYNKDVSPLDLLRAAAHDIETGKLKCDGLLIVFMDRPAEGAWEHSSYRANMTADAELVALELSRHKCLTQWIGDD